MTGLRIMRGSPFATIQGEGLYAGVPSVFLRTAGCDLRCHKHQGRFWHCDTPESLPDYDHRRGVFTVLPTDKAIHYEDLEWLADAVLGHTVGEGIRHLVITGGEPLLQADQLVLLVDKVMDRGDRCPIVTIETNARRFHSKLSHYTQLASLSPKLQAIEQQGGFDNSLERRAMEDWLLWSQTFEGKNVQIKIVCTGESDYAAAREVFLWAKSLTKNDGVLCIAQPASPLAETDMAALARAVQMDGTLSRLGIQAHKVWGLL